MIRFTIFACLLCICMSAYAQTDLKSGTLSIASLPTSVSGGRFLVTGTYSDVTGRSFASDIDTSMYMWKGVHPYKIDSILSRIGQLVTIRVVDIRSSGFISTGTALIADAGPSGALALAATSEFNAAYLTPPDYASIHSYNVNRIAAAVAAIDSVVLANNATGLFTPNDIPYAVGNGRLDRDGILKYISGQVQANSFKANEFFTVPSSISFPTAPASGINIFSYLGALSFQNSAGRTATFSPTSLTANRVYTLPDANGTLGLLESTQTWTGANTFNNSVLITGVNVLQTGKWLSNGARPTMLEAQLGYNQAAKAFEYSDGSNIYNIGFFVPATGANAWFASNIGIGTSTTTAKVNISGLGGTNSLLRILSTNASSFASTEWYNQSNDVLQTYVAGSTYSSGAFTSNSGGISYSGSGGLNIISYETSAPIRFFTGGTATTNERARFVSNGNLLLGTTTDIANSIFTVSSTNKYSLPDPRLSTAQRDALTGLTAGARVFNTTTNRPNYWDGTAWQESIGVASGGLGVGQIAFGNSSGNIAGSSQFVVNSGTGEVSFLTSTHGFRFAPSVTSDITFIAGGADRVILRRQGNDGLDVRNTSSLYAHISSTGTLIGGTGVTDRSQRISHFYVIPTYSSTGDIGGIGYGFGLASATYNNATTLSSGALLTFNTLVGGTGYLNGTYTGVALTGGSGTGATANITVSGGAVTAVTVNTAGSGYTVGNTLSAANTIIGGGAGSGFSINVATVASNVITNASAASLGVPTITSTNPGIIYTNFSTLRIASAPMAGANSIITNAWALEIVAGNSIFNGALNYGSHLGTSTIKGDLNFDNGSNAAYIKQSGSTSRSIKIPGTGGNAHWIFNNTAGQGISVFDGTNTSALIGSRLTFNTSGFTNGIPAITVDNSTSNDRRINIGDGGNQYATEKGYNVYIWSGTGGANNNSNGGDIILRPGAGGGTGLAGNVTLAPTIGSVSIGSATVNASSILDIVSTTKGFLKPRLTTVQRDAISSPATGLQIYNTTTNRDNTWNGTAWVEAPTAASGGIPNTRIAVGDASSNLTSFSGFTYVDGTISNSTTNALAFIFARSTTNNSDAIIEGLSTSAGGTTIQTRIQSTPTIGLVGTQSNHDLVFMTNGLRSRGVITSSGFWGIGSNSASSFFHITPAYSGTGDLSGGGYGFRLNSATYTNTTTAAAGTVASSSLASFDGGIIASTNAVTYTNASTVRIAGPPTAGTNSTLTNAWALRVESGNTFLEGNIQGSNGFLYTKSTNVLSLSSVATQQISLNYPDGNTVVNALDLRRTAGGFLSQIGGGLGINFTYRSVAGVWASDQLLNKIYDNGSVSSFLTGFEFYTHANESVGNAVTLAMAIRGRQVGIGTGTPVASALVEMTSTTQGLLIPRMSTVQRDAIVSPAVGLGIYNESTAVQNFFTGTAWAEYHVSSKAIVNTNNNHRLGWLMFLTSGTAGATGQAIRITGPDKEFELQGTGGTVENTFSFANYISKTGVRGISNANALNSFVRIYGGFSLPNSNNTTSALLSLTPVYDMATQTGAKITGIYYNPTLTSMVGVSTHNAWESTSGNVVISSGNVGIGAASPIRPLMISNANEDAFHITNTTSSVTARMGVGSGSFGASGWFVLQVGGNTIFTSDALNRFSISAARLNGLGSQSLTISGGFGAATLGTGIILSSNAIDAGVFTATSGTQTNVRIGGNNNTWQPASGNATFQSLLINPTFNTTGTYSGTARGIYYNPTITSVVGLTHNAIEITSGNVLFSGTGTTTLQNGTLFDTGAGNRIFNPATLTIQSNSISSSGVNFTAGLIHNAANGFSSVQIVGSSIQSSLTSGSLQLLRIGGRLSYSATGSANVVMLLINPVLDHVSGNTGISRGVFYDPSSVTNTTHRAWESTSGDFVINGGNVSIGSSTIPSAVAFQVVANNRMSIPAPVMTSILRDLMTGVEAGMVYSSSSDEYQFFDANFNGWVSPVKKGADAFFTDQSIIYSLNSSGQNQVNASGDFKYNPTSGTMSMLAEFSKINMRREPSATDLDAALTVRATENSSDANYYLRLVKGVDGDGVDSVSIHMSDGNLVVEAETKSLDLVAGNGYVSAAGAPFLQNRTQHTGSGSLQLSGRQNVAFISATATYTDITLPGIVTGVPGANQVRVGHELTVVILNSSSMTINAGASTAIYPHGSSTTPVPSVSTTGGTNYAIKFVAADTGKWFILGN